MSREEHRKIARRFNAGAKIDGNWHSVGPAESRLSYVLFSGVSRHVASFRTSARQLNWAGYFLKLLRDFGLAERRLGVVADLAIPYNDGHADPLLTRNSRRMS